MVRSGEGGSGQLSSNEGMCRYLGACANELRVADHYVMIKTAAHKPNETNKTAQSRDNYNFIELASTEAVGEVN